MTTEREEWGAKVTNPDFVDHGRVYEGLSKAEAEQWAESRNGTFPDGPRLRVVRRTITTTDWEQPMTNERDDELTWADIQRAIDTAMGDA